MKITFTHLHVHSHYSVLDGMSKVPDLVDRCMETGMMSVALTDHGNMYGIKELLDYCKALNEQRQKKAKAEGTDFVPFKPIVGIEAYCARRGRKSRNKDDKAITGDGKQYVIDMSGWHLILLAKNMQGYRNLCKIASESFMDESFYRTARIDKELLQQYHEGLICSSACLGGELPQKIMAALTRELAEGKGIDEAIEKGVFHEAEATIRWFKELFGEDYYIELQRHETQKPGGDQETYIRQKQVNPILIALAHKYGIKIICTNDVHFVREEHAEAHDRLICLSTNHFIDDTDRMHYTKQEWLKSPQEMADIFSDLPEALENTQDIVNKVEIYDIDSDPIMPKFPIPEAFGTEDDYRQRFSEEDLYQEFMTDEHGKNPLEGKALDQRWEALHSYERMYRIKLEADYLAFLTWKGAKVRYPGLPVPELPENGFDNLPDLSYRYWDAQEMDDKQREIADRILFELHVMKTMGFPGYFLIVMDFIRAAREELDVSVGPGRGSAAGSVVAYCLHITDLDPLQYDLLFERFLNPDRISLPDIDTDFDDAGRGKVLDWVSEKYGRTHVARIITYGAMAAKSAIADVGRVQHVPLQRVNELKSLIPDRGFPDNIKDEAGKSPKVNLKNCYKYVNELKQLLNGNDPEISSLLNYAQQLEGTIRQVGIHACGVIIGADDLTKFAPLSSVEDKETGQRVLATEYDGHVIESVGLIKMDFLGLSTLTIIKECLKNIKIARGEDMDIDHISKEDEDTYRLFQEGRTTAVFQFESAGMRKYMRELKPTVIGDLIAMNALYRPGPMEYIPSFIRRKHGEENITYDIPVMEKYLKDTYGITVYQEQVMLLSRLLAGFTRGESDKLRKAMGKKKIKDLEELKGKFMAGGQQNGHPADILEKIWKDWEAFASYAFNKSHAACYAWLAYQTAYLKAHYPAEFMAANLTIFKDDIKEVTKFMDECKSMKISVLEPDVNESLLNFTVNANGDIRFGLGGIKGVGEGAVEAIVTEREKNGKYKDIYDFLERVNLQACNRKTIESLAQAGAFDCFAPIYREQLLGINEKGESMLDVLIRYGNTYQQDKNEQQNSLFGDLNDGFGIDIHKPELPQAPRMSSIERLNVEKSVIGIFLSAHPLDEYAFEVNDLCNVTTAQLVWWNSHRKEYDTGKKDNNGRAVMRRRICLKDWQGVTVNNENDSQNEDANTNEKKTEQELMREFILRHQNTPILFGGIITDAQNRVSGKGNAYGVYTIEDYHGSYEFMLLGDSYTQYAPLLQLNAYVRLTATIQQAGFGKAWYKEKNIEEAEYEMAIQQVEMLNALQDKQLQSITLRIPINNVTQDVVEDLTAMCRQNPGKTILKIEVFDTAQKNVISFTSQSYTVRINPAFYRWIQQEEADEIMTHYIN